MLFACQYNLTFSIPYNAGKNIALFGNMHGSSLKIRYAGK
jgi:hypothetical protein